jgi:hypothetical protein
MSFFSRQVLTAGNGFAVFIGPRFSRIGKCAGRISKGFGIPVEPEPDKEGGSS